VHDERLLPEWLPNHHVRLADAELVLRPLTEDDVPTLLEWANDPLVRFFVEGEDTPIFSLADLRDIYIHVARAGYVFAIELAGRIIGECWLQQMNRPDLLARFPGRDLRRIDLMIGPQQLWGRGIGTRVIRLLTEFGFADCAADAIFGTGIHDFNSRSLGAFANAGYQLLDTEPTDSPGKGGVVNHILMIERSAAGTG
jgi:RimJ/RimL family protein N-acetyltransferase